MVTTTDVWWNSNPSSAELSHQAAQRSALSQAVAERRQRRQRRRISLSLPLRAWRLPRSAAASASER
ncbi:hypothetical protein [Pedococcus bigeumensis]|uniref:hypothetical protein n=1 Tax=Pedococcus bigeumensis TaxID=433644 RepID=UPI00112A1A19|nr:hypothetical protein [Pedococcus bigeumensis]